MENFSTDENIPPTSESIDSAMGNEGSGAVETNQQEEAPRKIAGLQAGRIVNYVMKGGCLRPFIIVNPGDGLGVVSGVLFFDGFSDASNFPADLGAPAVRDSFGRVLSGLYVVGASFDDGGTLVGTWHWPTKQAVVASGIDAAAFNALLDARAELFEGKWHELLNARVAQIEAGLTEKLNKTVESVNAALDSNNELLKKLLAPPAVFGGSTEVAASEPEAASGQQVESATGGAGS